MKPLAVFGTGSDAGKTSLVTALCRIFADRGIKVAPFKAQNVSNNSAVTIENGEIARAQCLQAEAARIEPSSRFNPVLLKSQGSRSVQVIVNGRVFQNQSIADYYRHIVELESEVALAFSGLQKQYDLVVAEGAGSPVELNLLDRDLSNTYIARTFRTQIILVADIERGGVFASIAGTLALMDPAMRNNLIGVIINKFRGDLRFFDDGIQIIEERFKIPVLGVVPFQPLNIDMEDSQSLANYRQRFGDVKLRIAAIAYPGLSNYNDLDALMSDPELDVEMIQRNRPLSSFDAILLPGSKTVIRDLQWLKQNGLFIEIQRFEGAIFGLCGGYQMLCRKLHDPDSIEHDHPCVESGFGLIDDNVVYQDPKILARGAYSLFGIKAVAGYEIHCGRMEKYPLFYQRGRIAGTHVHGVFDNNDFRSRYFQSLHAGYQGYDYYTYRDLQIQAFADAVAEHVAVHRILEAL